VSREGASWHGLLRTGLCVAITTVKYISTTNTTLMNRACVEADLQDEGVLDALPARPGRGGLAALLRQCQAGGAQGSAHGISEIPGGDHLD
jgi:hypothetical protein